MDFSTALTEFRAHQNKMDAYNHAMGLLYFDSETIMPKGAFENFGATIGVLTEEVYKLEMSEEFTNILKTMKENEDKLDAQTKKELEEILISREKIEKIPMDEFVQYQVLRSKTHADWVKAKETNNYELFKPALAQIIEFNKKFAKYVKPEEANIYNTMLNDYERGLTTAEADEYFAKVRSELVPLIAKIKEKPEPRTDFLYRNYPIDGQMKLSEYLMDFLNLNKDNCIMAQTEHPFETNFSNKDVRITTHFYENFLASSLYSVMHEGGHAMYELNTADELSKTVLASGTSMGVHESQSRFWENVVGRSKEFCYFVFPKIKEIFPEQLSDVTADEFYKAVNIAKPGLIRIEADELTYSMHVLIRYEIEKKIMLENADINELPAIWNKLYKEYLGVDVPNDGKGILQDVHWSQGMFGYFPSYSIGSAYAAQIAKSLEKEVDLKGDISKGDVKPAASWLKEHIYKHGKMLNPKQVINNCCGEDFSADYYIEYLKEKFSELYDIA